MPMVCDMRVLPRVHIKYISNKGEHYPDSGSLKNLPSRPTSQAYNQGMYMAIIGSSLSLLSSDAREG